MSVLKSVDDVLEIESKIADVAVKRNSLAKRFRNLEEVETRMAAEAEELDRKIDTACREIGEIREICDIDPLRVKYGKLKILDEMELLMKRRDREMTEQLIMDKIPKVFKDDSFDFATFYDLRKDIIDKRVATANVSKLFNEKLVSVSQKLIEKFKRDLLNSKWDTLNFNNTNKISEDLRSQSSVLYKLQKLWLPELKEDEDEDGTLWCFQCISNNFKIKFMYHFSNPNFEEASSQNQSIELYFKFLDRYLEAYLYPCVDIFTDDEAGVSSQMVHKQFINHTLVPMRSKISRTLSDISKNDSKESLRTMIVLISQIFINDNALVKKHCYSGIGLVSLIPKEILETWLSFEVESTLFQYERIIKTPAQTNGIDLVELLGNMYRYFEPCFNIEYDALNTFKLQIVSKIFLKLIENYNKKVLSPDPSLLQLNEEKQLDIVFCKLRNCIKLHDYTRKLSLKPSFLLITSKFNELNSSSYESVFSDSLSTLETTIATIRDSVVHRWKKILKTSLSPYFSFNLWHEICHTPTECSTELVPAVKMVYETRKMLESYSFPKNISMTILYEMVFQWVFYLENYVLKVNNFSKQGLDQLFVDYMEILTLLKPTDELPDTTIVSGFLEFLKILKLKYSDDRDKISFVDRSYISESSDYVEVRVALNLKYISNSELAYALYKIL